MRRRPRAKQPAHDASTRHLAPARTTPLFETYWRFAAERQDIFFRRVHGEMPPWSEDPIFQTFKFTNAYRASDRVSQYLIRHVIYAGEQTPREIFFRLIVFKTFNKIETWNLLKAKLGEVTFRDFNPARYDEILSRALERGEAIYSAAYIMPSGGRGCRRMRKHQNHIDVISRMMDDDLPARICDAKNMQSVFEMLRFYPMIGDFLAYQYAIDINYSPLTDFSEMDFVVPGPGALDGISKCFLDLGGLTPIEVIKLMTDIQEREFERLEIQFKSLWGRRLQLIDCQNLFCEIAKYSRVSHPEIHGITGRTRIKQKFSSKGRMDPCWYPPKWGINYKITKGSEAPDRRAAAAAGEGR